MPSARKRTRSDETTDSAAPSVPPKETATPIETPEEAAPVKRAPRRRARPTQPPNAAVVEIRSKLPETGAPDADGPVETTTPAAPPPRSRRRGQKPTVAEPVSEQTAPAPPNRDAEPTVSPAPRRRQSRKPAVLPPQEPHPLVAEPPSLDAIAFPDGPQVTPPLEVAPEQETAPPTRVRRRRTPVTAEEVAAEPLVVAPRRRRTTREPRPKPLPPPPKPLPLSENRIGSHNGNSTLVLDGRATTPLMFFGNIHSNATEQQVLAEVAKAAKAGVHTHVFLLELVVDESRVRSCVDDALYILDRVLEIDPDAHTMWRLVFAPAARWRERYPSAVYNRADGSPSEPSISADDWWGAAAWCLERFARDVISASHGDRVVGFHLERGEWFYGPDQGYDTSPAAREAFRRWVRRTYDENTVALRTAWCDGDASFNAVDIPPYRPGYVKNQPSLYEPRRERRVIDYHLFLSDAVADRLAHLAETVKRAIDNKALVGVSYGYGLEWAHPNSGHLALGRVLDCPYIDFVAGPPTYADRMPVGTAAYPSMVDSAALRGKLFISEEDFKTPGAKPGEPDDYNPHIRLGQALEQVHNRGLGAALVHGCGVSWMDLWGNGWLNNEQVWERAARFRRWWRIRAECPPHTPDVAVFVDERSIAHSRDRMLLRSLLAEQRAHFLRSGVSVGFYLVSDLMLRSFPECKLYVFLNAWNLSSEMRAVIRQRLQRDDKTLAWVYAGALYQDHRPALEQARDATGTALKPQPFAARPGTNILSRRHALTEFMGESQLARLDRLEPTYYSITEDAVTLGEYIQTGLPSVSVRDYHRSEGGGDWRSVFVGEPTMSPPLIHGLCNLAGAHIWNHQADVTHVRPPFVTIHSHNAGHRTITLPSRMSVYSLTQDRMLAEDVTNVKLFMQEGETEILLVAPHEQIAAMLAIDESQAAPAPETIRELEYVTPPAQAAVVVGQTSEADEDTERSDTPDTAAEPTADEGAVGIARRSRRRRGRGRRSGDTTADALLGEDTDTRGVADAKPTAEPPPPATPVPPTEPPAETRSRGRGRRATRPEGEPERPDTSAVQFRFRRKDRPEPPKDDQQ